MQELEANGTQQNLQGMRRFGIIPKKGLGVPVPTIRELAKKTGQDHELALKLWNSGVHEALLLATMVEEPAKHTSAQADSWTSQLYSWDICDQYCGNLLYSTPYAWEKVYLWVKDEREFVRRAGFALIAALSVKDKQASDSQFIKLLPLIEEYSWDSRNFVRKAVNWALRNIGKRNLRLNRDAISCANSLLLKKDSSSKWIAHDALRELEGNAVKQRLKEKERRVSKKP
jgi:3-methyladenine DNA glycosylase AlkD